MAQGKVKTVKKEYGFIVGQVDVFFHETEVLDNFTDLKDGAEVTFDVYVANNKIRARNVKLIKKDA